MTNRSMADKNAVNKSIAHENKPGKHCGNFLHFRKTKLKKNILVLFSLIVVLVLFISGCKKTEDTGETVTDSIVTSAAEAQISAQTTGSADTQTSKSASEQTTARIPLQTTTAYDFKPVNERSFYIYAIMPKLGSSDAKFYGRNIIATVDGKLCMFDKKGHKICEYYDVETNWIDSLPGDNLIIYGNLKKQTGLVRLDDQHRSVSKTILMETENLHIDPTITKIGDLYYITATEIKGNVNNSVEGTENGYYAIHVYTSEDLTSLNYLNDAVAGNNNLEDVDVTVKDGVIYLTYEREILDKGKSSIEVVYSADDGHTWSEPVELIGADADHEPAIFAWTDDGWILFYSSDLEHPGESYMGGVIYYARFDEKLNLIEKDIKINTQTQKGILLYDVQFMLNKLSFLYARDYMTDSDLVVECEN